MRRVFPTSMANITLGITSLIVLMAGGKELQAADQSKANSQVKTQALSCAKGEVQKGFRMSKVSSPSTCGAKITRTCENGQWNPVDPVFAKCEVVPAPRLERTDFLTHLQNPWDMAFTLDGRMYFTERCRGLSVRKADGSVRRLFGTEGSAVVAKDLWCEGQSGMLGVALDPNFSSHHFIYVYMSSNLSEPKTNRVIRLTVDPSDSSVSNRTDIVSDIAYKNLGNHWAGAGFHSGGRIRFGPDGFLYISTGDNHNSELPQSPTRLGGKVLRVTSTGAPAPGNRAPSGFDARIFTRGHRNVQGICFHPETHQVFISEHGPGHDDEVTPLLAGGNGGWDPAPAQGVSCEDRYCGYVSNRTDGKPTSMTDLEKFPDAMKPIWNNGGASEGTGPCEFLIGKSWKAWDGQLAVGLMRGARLEILQLDKAGALIDRSVADLPKSRFRSVVLAPDGNLYVAIDEGSIWKVTPR